MIGSGLVRFHPQIRRKQDGYGLVGTVWKTIQGVGPTMLKGVTLAGIKGLKEGVKGKNVNWKRGLTAAKNALKRKAAEELNKGVKKKFVKICLDFKMIPIYSRRVHRLPNYNNRRKTRRVYKGGSLLMGTPQLPVYRWVKGALKAKRRRRRRRR